MRRLRNRNFKTESISSIVDKLLREDNSGGNFLDGAPYYDAKDGDAEGAPEKYFASKGSMATAWYAEEAKGFSRDQFYSDLRQLQRLPMVFQDKSTEGPTFIVYDYNGYDVAYFVDMGYRAIITAQKDASMVFGS